jgi:hypothetical protein
VFNLRPSQSAPARAAAPRAGRDIRKDDLRIDRSIALGLRLVSSVESYARSLDVSGEAGFDITLPPIAGVGADQSHLRTVPPLYLASELEAAGLLPGVEMLAGLFVSGGIQADLGAAGSSLFAFWQRRAQRFSRQERQAFYARLFGDSSGPGLAVPGGRNTGFEDLMINLTEALYKLNPDPAIAAFLKQGISPYSEVSLQVAAESLITNLLPRSGGMAAYSGRDILSTIQQAIDIIGKPEVQQAVGAHTVWGAVANINSAYLHTSPDVDSHVTRGKAGMLVLAWLAEISVSLDDLGALHSGPQDPVVGAATTWLQASLALREAEAAAARND